MQRFAVVGLLVIVAARAAGAPPEFCVPVPADTQETLRCVRTGTSTMMFYIDTTYYYDERGNLRYGYTYEVSPQTYSYWHGYAKFDLSRIPDTATIRGAEFGFYQYEDTLGPPSYAVRAYDYAGGAAESLYRAIDSGLQLTGMQAAANGWNVSAFGDSGVAAVQSRLATDTLRLAVWYSGLRGSFAAYGTPGPSSLHPYLKLDYDLGGVAEYGPVLPAPGFALRPNPARGIATLRVPSGNWRAMRQGSDSLGVRVRVYDATGRRRLSLVSDIEHVARGARLDLRGLAAGIYLVRLESGSWSACHRLVLVD